MEVKLSKIFGVIDSHYPFQLTETQQNYLRTMVYSAITLKEYDVGIEICKYLGIKNTKTRKQIKIKIKSLLCE